MLAEEDAVRMEHHGDEGARTVRLGLIGCGRMASKHLRSMASMPQLALAAVSDVDAERMRQAADMYRKEAGRAGEIRRYASYEDLLASPDIDAVVITTTSALHAAIAVEAIRAGKPVMVEKPMALSLKEAVLIRSESKQSRVPVLVCHQLRYRPLFRQLKRLIDQGKLGDILYAAAALRIRRDEAYYAAASWRGKWELDGGMLVNQGIHVLDLLLWYLGEPEDVSGKLMRLPGSDKETEDAAVAAIRFASGSIGWFDANVVTFPNNLEQSLFICGTKGTVKFGGNALNELIRWHVDGFSEEEAAALAQDRSEHREMYRDFIRAVQTGGEPLMSAAEGERALALIFALYESHLEKRPVRRPRDTFSPAELNDAEVWNR